MADLNHFHKVLTVSLHVLYFVVLAGSRDKEGALGCIKTRLLLNMPAIIA